jgi:hypothetical protein
VRTTTDAQVRKLMEEKSKHGQVGLAAIRSGMDRKTARKYLRASKLPSAMTVERTWRTREDPFAEDWANIEEKLTIAPELEAKALFEDLLARRPGQYTEGQLRTLQRRIRRWRATRGPDKEVFFAQQHRPGEAMQTDFTSGNELGVTICGEPFPHKLCHPVLPYSNWEWATVCRSESMLAIRRGVQEAVFRLGRVTEFHQMDHSSAATHELSTGSRGFNDEYRSFVERLGMKPRSIEVDEPHQNGDVESLNGAFKRRLKQHLLLRGSRDFVSEQEYERWVQEIAEKANALRAAKVREDLEAMRPLVVSRLLDHDEETVTVSEGSTIRIRHNTYSVPSRLIGETVKVWVYENRLEVRYGQDLMLTVERLLGRFGHRIDYRHIIWSLVRKPGAFARYRYREELFPTVIFRRAYDALSEAQPGTKGDLEYLRVLHLAASTMESEVGAALELLLGQGMAPTLDQIQALLNPKRTTVPEMAPLKVDLQEYDGLLVEQGEVA